MKPHKWYNEIVAWASGAEIEIRLIKEGIWGEWHECSEPCWGDAAEYRIKPQPKEPQYLYVYRHDGKPELFTQELDISNPNRLQYIGKIKLEADE